MVALDDQTRLNSEGPTRIFPKLRLTEHRNTRQGCISSGDVSKRNSVTMIGTKGGRFSDTMSCPVLRFGTDFLVGIAGIVIKKSECLFRFLSGVKYPWNMENADVPQL